MLVPFNTLPKQSRIWIYQSNKSFTNQDILKIKEFIEPFVNQWQRHGKNLKASYKIIYNQFIVLAVDESNDVSGCSIDASVHLIKQIEKEFKVNLTDKMKTTFKNGDNINMVSLADFKKYVSINKITKETVVFNNMVDTIEGLNNNWEVPAKKSWHKKYFK